jgi:NAD(P)-dependent dehydrogenase (short-subunit alcohol dehydrogenase family)
MDEKRLNRRQVLAGVAVTTATAGLVGQAVPATAASPNEPPMPDMGPSQPPPIKDVKDKVAYITGGSSGIGLGIARALHEQGAKVVLGNLDDKQFDEALKMFPANDPRVATVVHNVLERDLWEAKADEIEKKFGPVNILVNNAGVGLGAGVTTGTYKDWEWGMGVNFWGPVYGVKTFVPRMRARPNDGCHVVTTTSTSGVLVGLPVGIYAVSKIAATGLMEQLRDDLRATNIGTSILIPGITSTNIGRSETYRPDSLKNDTPPPPRPAQQRPANANAARPAPVTPPSPIWARPQDPVTVGRLVVNAILNNDLFIYPAPEYRQGVEARAQVLVESMVAYTPFPENIQTGMQANRYFFTPMYVQEVRHRRATRKRDIAGV